MISNRSNFFFYFFQYWKLNSGPQAKNFFFKKGNPSQAPVILATQEAEIRRIMVQSQPRQTVLKTLSQKKKTKKTIT
jgi:hypothetical protein